TMPETLEDTLRSALSGLDTHARPGSEPDVPALDAPALLAVFTAQLESRATDLVTRELRGRGRGYYSIASAGHEANAAVAAALRPTDPALLHYRSGAFYTARGVLVDGREPLRDVLLGLVAATD